MSPAKTPAPTPAADVSDIPQLSYEAARDELVSIVQRLESGSAGLEESMRLWERGEALADHCAAWLDGAERRLRREEQEAPPRGAGRDPRAQEADDDPDEAGDAPEEIDEEIDEADAEG